VTHSDQSLFCKLFEHKKGTVTKITVQSSGSGKEYTLSIKKGDQPAETSTNNKKYLLAKLTKDNKLVFMVKYIECATSLV
jgi:hypothetical protein